MLTHEALRHGSWEVVARQRDLGLRAQSPGQL